MDPVRIVATGGGTAGHVLPHFSVLDEQSLQSHAHLKGTCIEIYYMGSQFGIEKTLVNTNQPSWTYIPIRTGKFRRYASWKTFIEPFSIFWGFLQALHFFIQYKPHLLFSKGGYVSAPSVWAAWLCRIPIVIHESDATPALTTRLTAPFANSICLTFAESLNHFKNSLNKKCTVTGLPLRSELFEGNRENAHKFFAFSDKKKPVLLVFGGSLGAQALNNALATNRSHLLTQFNIIHITGDQKQDGFSAPGYRQFPYLHKEMPLAYALADIALCRAGASSLFELAAKRIPMVLVPLGIRQSRGDQIINSSIFKKKNWAVVLTEEDLSSLSEVLMNTYTNREFYQNALQNAPGPDKSSSDVQKILIKNLKRESPCLSLNR